MLAEATLSVRRCSEMAPLCIRDVVAQRPIEAVVGGRVGRCTSKVRETRDSDDPHLILARQKREVGRGWKIGQLFEPQPAVREPCRIEEPRRHDALVLDRDEHIARDRIGRVLREAGRHGLIRRVRSIAAEERILVGDGVIDSPLIERLPRGLIHFVRERRNPPAHFGAVWQRIQIEVRTHHGVDWEERGGTGRLAGHEARVGNPQVLLQALHSPEEKQAVPPDRPARACAKLIAAERRRLGAVEEAARIHRAVAEELERRPVEAVRAALGDEAHDSTHRPAVVG